MSAAKKKKNAKKKNTQKKDVVEKSTNENIEPKKDTKENAKKESNEPEKIVEKKEKATDSEKKVSTNIKEEKKDEKQQENKADDRDKKLVVNKENKPEYVQQMIKNKKRKMYIFICFVILVILILAFSTLFAIFNLNNSDIIKGITIKEIDISGLSTDDAISKLTEVTNNELVPELYLKYGEDYETSINHEQIEFKYEIQEAVKVAYNKGRSGNIVENNYSLIFTALFGKDVPITYTYNEELLNQFVENVSSEIPGVVIEPSYYIEDGKLIVNKGIDGVQVKKDELKQNILDAIFDRKASDIKDDSYKQEIKIPVEEKKADDIDIDKIYSEIHTKPQDAYFETDPYKIYPDVDGVDLAILVEEAKNIIKSEEKEEYVFDLKITKAEKTIDDLGKEAFPYLISSFTTKYDASNTNRSTNLKIAAEKINGKVLMPGEEFSYNQVVGKRTVEAGYKDAKIYADGGVVDGLAGGICQISSTLYNAVLLANLEVTERKNHTYTTSYVPAGKDATVVYGVKDFKFKNSRSYPIKIEASVSNGIAEFKIHGISEEKEYEIKILPVTTASIPYTTSYVEDATLAPGQQVVSQSGHAGYKVTTYKEVRYNGELVSKEVISNDTYSPMQTIIKIGPGIPVQ